jgi:hypothetical protein
VKRAISGIAMLLEVVQEEFVIAAELSAFWHEAILQQYQSSARRDRVPARLD